MNKPIEEFPLPWNPLIKELTCEAVGKCDPAKMTAFSSSVDTGCDGYDIPLEFSEKFAEIIVGYATECVRGVLREPNSTLSYEDATAIQNSINQTFGIKTWREKLGETQ